MQNYNDESAKQKVIDALGQFEVALEEMKKGVVQLREAVERDWHGPAPKLEAVK